MNTCKDCKWWQDVVHRKHKYCNHPDLMPLDDTADYKLDSLLYWDKNEKFWSGPDFGCIHHEPKDEK